MSRTFVIGDIHGALKALKQLITKINIRKEDHLIFLGDYTDGWPDTAELITFLIYLDNFCNCIFIKGNHDAWCEAWLNGETPANDWLISGGKATIESYNNLTEENKKVHLAFFNKMKFYHIDAENRLFIHAGFSSMHGPVKERYETNFYWDRTLWEMALAMDKEIKKGSKIYPKRLSLFNEIYIGHTPTLNYGVEIPMQACSVWNIDTGAGFNGKLSALDIESKFFLQSDNVQSFYPADKGRNI